MIDPQNFVLATVNELFFLPDKFIESAVLWLLLALLILGLALLVFYVISLPLRRQERDRFLLDVIESALAQGEQVERYIISLAQTRDRSPGIQFHLLAAHLETGCSFVDALEKTPRLFPPQLLAMLKVGESIGDLKKVLPACRKLLRDGISQSRAAINYQVVFAFVLNPMVLLTVPFLAVKIMPVFGEIFSGFGMKFSSLATTAIKLSPYIFAGQMLIVLALYFFAILFLGGPRLSSWLQAGVFPLGDWIVLRLPWRRKRLQRDFSAMLALLLDAEVPEERAVLFAAASTANRVFVKRAEKIAAHLRAGVKLTEAIQILDDTGEFRWRLENAAHFSSNFFRALKGWHESLDAKAFQLEQSAAQTITTALVLVNAFSVCLVSAAIFQCLAQIHRMGIQ
jgi:type II secretory pathway component PulF